jgi:hypothetical protein
MTAVLEVLHGIRRSTLAARRQATTGAFISFAIALLLINAPFVAGAALLAAMAGFFLVDAARYAIAVLRPPDSSSRALAALAVAGNLGVALLPRGTLPWPRFTPPPTPRNRSSPSWAFLTASARPR